MLVADTRYLKYSTIVDIVIHNAKRHYVIYVCCLLVHLYARIRDWSRSIVKGRRATKTTQRYLFMLYSMLTFSVKIGDQK